MIKTKINKYMKRLNKPLYSIVEICGVAHNAFRMTLIIKKDKKKPLITKDFQERLFLAVTEVNGCALCSYAHTQWALEAGVSNAEIEAMMAGEFSEASSEELPALMFAQHYADMRGHPSESSWSQIVQIYTEPKSVVILAYIRMIMFGNAIGIPIGSLKSRFGKKKKSFVDARSTLPYELLLLLCLPLIIVFTNLSAFISNLVHRPIISFRKTGS